MCKVTEAERNIIDVVELGLDWGLNLSPALIGRYREIVEKIKCKNFVCDLNGSCLYIEKCTQCKIEKCEVCKMRKTCKKRRTTNESKI